MSDVTPEDTRRLLKELDAELANTLDSLCGFHPDNNVVFESKNTTPVFGMKCDKEWKDA